MKILEIYLVLIVAAFVITCSANIPKQTRSSYQFDVDGISYQIISISAPPKSAYNILLLHDNAGVKLRAIDETQDGTIDTLAIGDISVADANAIYEVGIELAKTSGNFKRMDHGRTLQISNYPRNYLLATDLLIDGEIQNKLTVINEFENIRTSALDTNADGVLDVFVDGTNDLESYQDDYEMILKRGLLQGKVYRKNGRYLVREKR